MAIASPVRRSTQVRASHLEGFDSKGAMGRASEGSSGSGWARSKKLAGLTCWACLNADHSAQPGGSRTAVIRGPGSQASIGEEGGPELQVVWGAPTPRRDYLYCNECRWPWLQGGVRTPLGPGKPVPSSARPCSAGCASSRSGRPLVDQEQDPSVFVEEILPLIQPLSTAALSRATGLSRTYYQDVRNGKYVPHPRHWEGFRRVLLGLDRSASSQVV